MPALPVDVTAAFFILTSLSTSQLVTVAVAYETPELTPIETLEYLSPIDCCYAIDATQLTDQTPRQAKTVGAQTSEESVPVPNAVYKQSPRLDKLVQRSDTIENNLERILNKMQIYCR